MSRSSPLLDPEIASLIKGLLPHRLHQHQIAALLHINQGRISEVKTGKRFAEVPPASEDRIIDLLQSSH